MVLGLRCQQPHDELQGSALDGDMTGSVKFGDGSKVDIRGRGTIIFWFQNGEHRALTDVYYIPQLRSSIISIG